MGGILMFRTGVLARRTLFRRESWVPGVLLVFDDDVRFFTPHRSDLGSGILDYFHWSEVVGVQAQDGLVRGAVDIGLRRGEQRFRRRGAVRLAQRLERVRAAYLGNQRGPVAPPPADAVSPRFDPAGQWARS